MIEQQPQQSSPAQSGAIGVRGLVAHFGTNDSDGYKYFPDNATDSWRKHKSDLGNLAEDDRKSIEAVVKAGAPAAVIGKGIFVLNLDAFHNLPAPQEQRDLNEPKAAKAPKEAAKLPADLNVGDVVLIHELGRYYALKVKDLKELHPLDAGEPKILVRRGALAAAIPAPKVDAPFGRNGAVLLNVTELAPPAAMTRQPEPTSRAQPGEIGARGLVVHIGANYADGYKCFPDNETESWSSREVKLGDVAARVEIDPNSIEVVVRAGAPAAAIDKRVFVLNLDAFHNSQVPKKNEETKGSKAAKASREAAKLSANSNGGDVVVIHELGQYYELKVEELKDLHPLDADEPKILVRRGAIAAAIPTPDIDAPFGTHCVLLNVTQLVPQ